MRSDAAALAIPSRPPDRAGTFLFSVEQAERLPRGPLGLLEPPEVTLVGGIPPAAVALVKEYLAGACGTMEFASRFEALRLETIARPTQAIKP